MLYSFTIKQKKYIIILGDFMIINSKKVLLDAKKNKIAIPHFNINNLEWTKYILEECNRNNCPVILGVSEGAIKYMGGTKTVANIIKALDEELNIKIPVIIHLDHGSSIEMCKKAIDDGFTSVMIDASKYSLEENIKLTKEVVEYAKKNNVTVEAELGHIGEDKLYANVEESKIFVKETNIDSLAPAIGTVHGIYKSEPNLDIELCNKISKEVDIPLVLHGGSGLDDETLKKVIQAGICKININTELQQVWSKAVRKYLEENESVYDPRKIISSGEEEMKKIIKHKIDVLSSK